MDIEKYLLDYYAQNGKKIRKVVDKILKKFPWITDKDQFYSLANVVFTDVLNRYDEEQDFDGFLYSCLENKIKTEITRCNRIKRTADRNSISIDTPIGGDENSTLSDITSSDYDLEREVCTKDFNDLSSNAYEFMSKLSNIQREIVVMMTNGASFETIKTKLKLKQKQLENHLEEIKSIENILPLTLSLDRYKEKREMDIETIKTEGCILSTRDKTKRDSNPISSYIKKLKKGLIRTNYCLQRNDNQWSYETRDELIATALNDLDIPYIVLCHQQINGQAIVWLIDGLQRLTTFFKFHENAFKLGNKIERYNIPYQAAEMSEDGTPVVVDKICDIRGKYYRDLPEEVQEMFDDYSVMETRHLDCTDEEIEYHIRRYNSAKQMNNSQSALTYIGAEFGNTVKKYTRNHEFFKNIGNYKPSERKNGTLERIVSESIMAMHFLDDWKKKTKDLCWYLKKNATSEQFRNFEEVLDRLSDVLTVETREMFTGKDSFLYFTLFGKFIDLDIEDEKFVEFLNEFREELHSKKINDISYDDLDTKSTKDKKIVVGKINILTKLMYEFLHISNVDAV